MIIKAPMATRPVDVWKLCNDVVKKNPKGNVIQWKQTAIELSQGKVNPDMIENILRNCFT